MFGKEAVVEVVHGGVECGIFTKKIKGLDVVSIGPDIIDIHTASEKLSVSSTKRVWDFLLALLAELK
jgi:dipeptidase D